VRRADSGRDGGDAPSLVAQPKRRREPGEARADDRHVHAAPVPVVVGSPVRERVRERPERETGAGGQAAADQAAPGDRLLGRPLAHPGREVWPAAFDPAPLACD
jgi:hypothetical protein